MSGWQRLAGWWGALFPVAALVLFAVLTGFGARGATPDTTPGQTSGASQTTAQSGGTTSGGGSGGNMESGGSSMTTTSPSGGSQATTSGTPSGTATTGDASTTGTASTSGTTSGSAASGGTQTTTAQAQSGATQGTATQNSGAQSSGAQTSGTASSGDTSANATAQGGTPTAAAQSSSEGAQIYTTNCQSCHGPAGAGVAGAFPPLAGNKAILGSEKYVADVLLYGLQGQIQVNGQTYNGVMPAWAATLSDAQIAAVLDHVRSSWGNSAAAVTAATVKTERATTLSTAQVLAERPQ